VNAFAVSVPAAVHSPPGSVLVPYFDQGVAVAIKRIHMDEKVARAAQRAGADLREENQVVVRLSLSLSLSLYDGGISE
jgi:hypothetical protein